VHAELDFDPDVGDVDSVRVEVVDERGRTVRPAGYLGTHDLLGVIDQPCHQLA